ncbi:hypothetical protein ACOTZ9_23925, partial [Enterobacter cloacae complex sp. ZZL003]
MQQVKTVINAANTPLFGTQHRPGVRETNPERAEIKTTGFPGRREYQVNQSLFLRNGFNRYA